MNDVGGLDNQPVNSKYSSTTQEKNISSDIVQSTSEYQLGQLEYQNDYQHTPKPHNNMPPYVEVYIWECVSVYNSSSLWYYDIYYNMNGHGTQPEDALTWYDDRTPLPYSPPTPSNVEGYEFKGWEPSEIPVGSRTDIVFNAKWELRNGQ